MQIVSKKSTKLWVDWGMNCIYFNDIHEWWLLTIDYTIGVENYDTPYNANYSWWFVLLRIIQFVVMIPNALIIRN